VSRTCPAARAPDHGAPLNVQLALILVDVDSGFESGARRGLPLDRRTRERAARRPTRPIVCDTFGTFVEPATPL